MKVFEQEKIDGLEELIVASQTETIQAKIKPSKKKEVSLDKLNILASVVNQEDLYVYNSILCTVGEPNGNDICFLANRVLPVKDTPINKQVNLNHTDDVVGHMVGSYLVDDEYEPLEYDPLDPPSYFHVLVESVIYRSWKTDEREAEIANLIQEIEDDKWCVSLECLSRGFDYAFVNSEDKTISLIERTDDTAYLTKYLKKFKGAGEYNGKRIYCAPKDFIFSGKGLTQNPANLKSVIVAEKNEDKNENVYLKVDENINHIHNNLGDNIMTEDERKQLIKDIKDALSITASAPAELKEGFDFKAAFETLNKVVADLTEKVDNFINSNTAKVGQLETELASKTEEVTTLTASLDTVSKEKETVLADLNKEIAEKTENIRVAKVITKGLDEASAKTFVANTKALSDEQFDLVVNNISLKEVASTQTPSSDIDRIETSEPEPAPVKVTASSEDGLKGDFINFWNSKDKSEK